MAPTVTPPMPPGPAPVLGYRRRRGVTGMPYDEMLRRDGAVREHWRDVAGFFERLGPEEIARRWTQARKILRDNGVAYNVQTQGVLRTWELNPVPLRLSGAEWQSISRAVRQRARLLDHILADAYGEQRLLKERLLPPALVLGNASYLRPCRGIAAPEDPRLVIYAADLARSPDGNWWVVSDRTQAPSGMGYTLENRLVLSRVFPEAFRELRIARLGGFFSRLAESLAALSPRRGSEPTIALLTPGSLNETYFEQAYLARHLGCALVQGQDLTARDGRIYIKTLDGLRQVDVILRRVDEDYCDPLELRDDSLLGVPGLVAAVRAGTVAVANALGSGLVQGDALHAFLPVISRQVLGEDLLMPSVATWWCGDKPAREYVINNLHGLTLKDAFEYPGGRLRPGQSREEILAAIQARPNYFAAQENVQLSQSPDFVEGRLEPRSIVLRVFAVRRGDDYEILPGGLTRVAAQESSYSALLQQSGGSKDTWVDATEEPLPERVGFSPAIELRSSHLDLTSRVADSLFWLGRYAERTDFTARIARCVLENVTEEFAGPDHTEVAPLLATLRHFGQFSGLSPGETLEQAVTRQMADGAASGSIHAMIKRLQDIAASVRDQISNDTWRNLNILGDITHFEETLSPSDAALQLNNVILALSAFQGLLSENMPHGHAWRFLDLGRRIERGFYLARLASEILSSEPETSVDRYELLLETLDALVTYRQKYAALRPAAVLELMLCDESNPRSLATQLAICMDHLRRLPREASENFKLPEERQLLAALSGVRLLDPAEAGDARLRVSILQTLAQTEKALATGSELITLRFFTHLRTSSLGRDRASAELPSSL